MLDLFIICVIEAGAIPVYEKLSGFLLFIVLFTFFLEYYTKFSYGASSSISNLYHLLK